MTKKNSGVFNTELLSRESINEEAQYIRHYAKSVELIQASAKRGMSRRAMEKIWPYKLLNLVLGHEVAK